MNDWELFGIIFFSILFLIGLGFLIYFLFYTISTPLTPITPNGPTVETIEFISISDIHLNNFKNCDLSNPTDKCMVVNPSTENPDNDIDSAHMNLFLNEINTTINSLPNVKFIIVTGDSGGHTSSNSRRRADIQQVLSSLHDTFNLPILYVFGNDDATTRDYGPFLEENVTLATNANWSNAFSTNGVMCTSGIYPCIDNLNQSDNTGYYSGYLAQKLKIIALNSVQFSSDSKADHTGATEQLLWLTEQLDIANGAGDSVLLIMHINPSEWSDIYYYPFIAILNRFPSTIMGALTAHTHWENVQIISLSSGQFVVPLIYTAALSTAHGNAPSFKHHTFGKIDNGPWVMKDYTTYSFQQPNSSDDISLINYYTFNETYCPNTNTNITKCLTDNLVSRTRFNDSFMNGVNSRLTAGNPNYHHDQYPWVLT